MTSPRFSLGLSVHTGWAAACVVGGDLRKPSVAAREVVEILGDLDRFVFHAAAKMAHAEGERSVATARRNALAAAKASIAAIVERMRAEGREITRCAIVARHGEMPGSLEEIVAAHPRMHTAEGLFYRDVLREAAIATGLEARVIAPKELDAMAARVLEVAASEIATLVAAAGRGLGAPWGRDEKVAALAGWMVMGVE